MGILTHLASKTLCSKKEKKRAKDQIIESSSSQVDKSSLGEAEVLARRGEMEILPPNTYGTVWSNIWK